MPTLSFDGSVYFSSEVDRRELVRIAPAYTVSVLMNRARSTILAAQQHEVNFTDLPGNQCTNFFFSLSEGGVTLAITDALSSVASYSVTPSGLFIMMNTIITGLTITGVADSSVYDLIAGA
jgi:hypothetical protein